MGADTGALLSRIAQLEAELGQEQQARRNAAAMAERQKRRAQRLQESLNQAEETNRGLLRDLRQMAGELQALQPGWTFQR